MKDNSSIFFWAAGLTRGHLLKPENRKALIEQLLEDSHLAWGLGALEEALWEVLPEAVRQGLLAKRAARETEDALEEGELSEGVAGDP
jgi:hypothetical protein